MMATQKAESSVNSRGCFVVSDGIVDHAKVYGAGEIRVGECKDQVHSDNVGSYSLRGNEVRTDMVGFCLLKRSKLILELVRQGTRVLENEDVGI
jgi:hypothetical protein